MRLSSFCLFAELFFLFFYIFFYLFIFLNFISFFFQAEEEGLGGGIRVRFQS